MNLLSSFLEGLLITGGVGFSLVALGLYVESRWVRRPRQRKGA